MSEQEKRRRIYDLDDAEIKPYKNFRNKWSFFMVLTRFITLKGAF